MSNDSIVLELRVVPRSSRDELIKECEGWKVKLRAPPVDGAANEALIKFLAKEYGVPRASVHIISGATARKKLVKIIYPQ